MSKFKGLLFVSAIALAFGSAGCSDDSGTKADGGKKDGPIVKADMGPKPTIDCATNDCKDYVFSRILLPTTPQEAQAYGVDFNGDSVEDNALGAIISALASVSTDFAIQPTIDETVYSGATILLLQVQASDLTNQASVAAQAFIGKKMNCCPGNETDPVACKAASLAGCFSGTGIFEKDPAGPTDAILAGKIASGNLTLGPATVRIQIPLSATGTIDVNLQQAQIKGKINADGIMSGVLAGVVEKTELDNNIIPAVATLLQDALANPAVSEAAKKQMRDLFDTNSDGSITKEEVAGNELIKTFLAGDVDVNNDGKPELSLGIGFEAVKATYGTIAPTPDMGAADMAVAD